LAARLDPAEPLEGGPLGEGEEGAVEGGELEGFRARVQDLPFTLLIINSQT
jgi:hypothetical protein